MSVCLIGASSFAAPAITNLSLRGLQSGGSTKLIVDGKELAPGTRLLLSSGASAAAGEFAPSSGLPLQQTLTPTSTAERIEAEVKLPADLPAGIYLLRVASAQGISPGVLIGVDALPQVMSGPQVATLPIAVTGNAGGSGVFSTSFAGKKGQQIVAEVESRRLGAMLNPVVHLYDPRHVQLAWNQGLRSLQGDARCAATLPVDGQYTVEVHDALFRGADPSYFRLKLGELVYADLALPMGVQVGQQAALQFVTTNAPADARANVHYLSSGLQPAGLQTIAGKPIANGPSVIASEHAELLEQAPADGATPALQQLPAAPVGVSGRLARAGENDRYLLAVTPGETLRFELLANRAGSSLDGVLVIANEQGGQLAYSDDRPNTVDPGLDFKVPDGQTKLQLIVRDVRGAGGADFVYHLEVTRPGDPDFSLSLQADRELLPAHGVAVARVKAARNNYAGPIKLRFHLPANFSASVDEIPAGADEALVTLQAGESAEPPAPQLISVTGVGLVADKPLVRVASLAGGISPAVPAWLRKDVGLAVAPQAPITPRWSGFASDRIVLQGVPIKLHLEAARLPAVAGPVRFTLVTTQIPLKKTVKVNNQDQQVDDVDRMLRFDGATQLTPEQSALDTNLLVPGDLPPGTYDAAIKAELLSADGKVVLAEAFAPAQRLVCQNPLLIELTGNPQVEGRAGLGPAGKLTGKVIRKPGFTLPVAITLTGLPKDILPPHVQVGGDQSDFELPVTLSFGAPAGDLAGVRLVAESQATASGPQARLRSNEIPVQIKVVPGENPPGEQPLLVFEDQPGFAEQLKEGGGQASLFEGEKFSGAASLKVTPDQKVANSLPGLGVKIREKPAAGEYRYLQFAWKKQGGSTICLQLNHDGQWGPQASDLRKFRYHAGPGPECFGASLPLDPQLPSGFVVITRDLFADFGEFTLTGLAFSPLDGEFALFDHLYLGRSPDDFELVKQPAAGK